MEKFEFISPKNATVAEAILEQKPNLNYAIIKTALRKKDVRLNGKKICENLNVYEGDIITLFLPNKKTKYVPVVYQDENIIIACKPSGMETTKKDKAYTESECLEDVFEGCMACHRLDKITEGLVVLAKNQLAKRDMEYAIKQKNVTKFYKAIVTGKVNSCGENLKDYLVKNDGSVKIFEKEVPNSKVVLTNYSVLKQDGNLFLLDIELLTGRTHQIRAQLSFHGIYILGDQKYGLKSANRVYGVKKQLLCASKISFKQMPKNIKNLSGKTFEIAPTFSLQNFI